MRAGFVSPVTRLVLLGILLAGWLVGLVVHWSDWEATGYGDISQELIVLGAGLCLAAGAVSRWLMPLRTVRAGIASGVVMMGTILVGNVALTIVQSARGRIGAGVGDETWFSLLIESWFWIGVPLLVSAALGAVGWLLVHAFSGLGQGLRTR